MSIPSLYQQLVLEHSRAPRRFGDLAEPTHAADGANPLCGDALHVELRVVDGRIVGYAFRGEACAIARASASMLGDRIAGRDVTDIDGIRDALNSVVEGRVESVESLGDLNALAALARYPSRRKCALLPVAAAVAALSGSGVATTEKNENEDLSK